MIYLGHGHYAREAKGNHLQYSQATNGIIDTEDVCKKTSYTEAQKDMFCFYSQEARFGAPESDLRWVWMYTCNFLNSIEDIGNDDGYTNNDGNYYVYDSQLAQMMTGAHIVMGYASRATLCDTMAERFSEYLYQGIPICEAYKMAGIYGETEAAPERHYQKIMYIPQAQYETVYSPQIHYEYDASDIIIEKWCIQDGY
jgi:hypothetical protein